MFIAIVSFSPIKEGKEAHFLEWFHWSNSEFSKVKGFIRRRLLKPLAKGNYASVVEFESQEDFKAMQKSPMYEMAAERVATLLDGHPTPSFYEVVME